MNFFDFTQNGGYRFKQYTLRLMQEAYFQLLKAFVAFCKIPEAGNYIISGCTISGANITDGYLYINGELCKFTQTAGTTASLIRKKTDYETVAFKNGTNPPVIKKVSAEVHVSEGTALSDFIRVSPVFDANYVHTDNNYANADVEKLANIEAGAQVNVKPSWTAPEGDADGILNKPVGTLVTELTRGSFIIGDVIGSTELVTIPFGIDVGTDDYTVVGSLVSNWGTGTDYTGDSKVVWKTREQTNISFGLLLEDYENGPHQNLTFNYIIIPN